MKLAGDKMSFEKFDGNLEKSSVEHIETNASQLEKNIEVEKPDSRNQ